MPECQAGADGYVEGVFCSELGDLEADVGGVHDLGCHAVDFMSGDNSVFFSVFGPEGVEADASLDLFEHADPIASATQFGNGVERVVEIFPFDGVFRSEGGFVDFGRRRGRGDSAKHHAVNKKGVGGPEDRSDVVERTNVVEHNRQRQFLPPAVLFDRIAMQIPDGFLFHSGCVSVDD